MWSPATSALANWSEQLCSPRDDSMPTRGYLADDPRIDGALQSIMNHGPSLWVVVAGPFAVARLWNKELVILPNRRGYAKMVVTVVILIIQLASLVGSSQQPRALAEQLIYLARDAIICALSFFEHGRNTGPSTILTGYLALAISGDIIQFGLLFVAWNLCAVTGPAAAVAAARVVLFVLETRTKRSILRAPYPNLSPEETAGLLGTSFFWWVNRVLKVGYSKSLSLEDMPPLDKALDAGDARDAMIEEWAQRKMPEARFALMRAQFKCLWWPNMVVIPPRLALTLLRCCQPLLISRTIKFVTNDLSPFETRNEGFRLLLAAFVIYTGMAVLSGVTQRLLSRAYRLSRMGLIGIIYNESLLIKDGISDESAAITLMTDDAEDAANLTSLFDDLWSQVLELGIGMYMLADEMGWVCILPPLVVLATSKIVEWITENLGQRQMAFSQATQSRISATKAVLDSMKNIKMMGLVERTEARLQKTRENELEKFTGFYRLLVAYFVSSVALHLFSPAITLIFYAIQAQLRGQKSFDVEMIFTSIAIIEIVAHPANALLGTMPEAASVMAAFDRIQKFLLAPEVKDTRQLGKENDGDESVAFEARVDSRVAVKVADVTIRPGSNAEPVLHNITTECSRGDLVVIAGAVGVGKTTLAKAVLGDLPADSGVIHIADKSVAYCSQTPWLVNGTIKEVICGPDYTETEDGEAKYKKVIHVCDLEEDFRRMPDGDQTVVGSRGITLSGGQKQRVALARAVFADRDFIILDDVLSALDATTERHIVSQLLGQNGLFKERGTTVLLISHAAQHLPLADHIIIIDENGRIAEQGTWEELRNSSGYCSRVQLEEGKQAVKATREVVEPREIPPKSADEQSDAMQYITRGTGDAAIYRYYFSAIGAKRLAFLTGSLTLNAILRGAIPYWLRWMAESKGAHMWFYTSIYLLLTIGAFSAIASAVATIFLLIAPHAGFALHQRLLRTVMHAPQSFFAKTDTGKTLNRFSTDMMMIDRSLPFALFQVLQAVFLLVSQGVVLGVVQPLILVTLPVTVAVVYVVQKVYLATSKQLRFIDLEARALVNASFLETLEGVSTIRAFGWQKAFIDKNARKLDLSMRPDYLLMCIQRWLYLVLDLIVPGLALAIIGIAIWLKGTTTGGQIGIALNVVLKANQNILNLITAFIRLETSLGAISRLRAFEQQVQPEEQPGMANPADKSWPAYGAVEFTNFSASYNSPALALDDVTVSIKAGAKVGVVGRTGSGKSSLLLSLLRLIDTHGDGTVRIDGVDLATVPRNVVRSRIITVPQDPMLVKTDTVRQNLNITGADISDEDMVAALDRVGLWKTIVSRTAEMSTDGSDSESNDETGGNGDDEDAPDAVLGLPMRRLPLSQGQQQLFSLARALLMKPLRGRLVLLDEATSNVDVATDKTMQRIVREEFSAYTVITVAHRLDTIMDSDIVLVLSGGTLVEMGAPSELRAKQGGAFHALVAGGQ